MKDKFSYVKELIKQATEVRQVSDKVSSTILALGGEVPKIPTKKAEEAKRILENSKLYITLEEMQELEKQATEESKEILGISEVIITAEEMQNLEKQATEIQQPKDDPISRAIRSLSISGEEPKIPTDKAKKAKQILEKAKLHITVEEMQDLEKQSAETQQMDDPIFRAIRDLSIGGEEPKIPTDKAIEAKRILEKAELVINLKEMQDLEKQAAEVRQVDDPAYSAILALGGEETMIPTKKAEEAKRILGKAKLHITVEEMQDLEKQASEIQQPKDDPVFRAIRSLSISGEEPKIPTDRAIQAQKILNKDNLEVVLGEARERIVFTPEEIGKGTLVQQGKTMEKKQEESTRAEIQLQQEESLGKE